MKYYACLFDYREIILLLILMLIPVYSQGQNINTESFKYLSPLPNSKFNSAETNIIVRFGKAFDNSVINKSPLFTVTGSKSGVHSGKIVLTENGRTLIYNPNRQFEKGERVTVELRNNFKTINGDTIPSLFYSFEITNSDINKHLTSEFYLKKLFPDLDYGEINNSTHVYNIPQQNKFKRDTLPEDFPEIFIDSTNNPSEGFIFFSPFLGAGLVPSYLIIADNYGTPVYYKKITGEIAVDFKKQENGLLTYYHNEKFYVMDSSYTIIDSLYTQNGYPTDLHECIILDNGHTLLMSYDDQVVRMDTIVPGGDPEAVVAGLIIQELDENKNVVFQWRSWDHFEITDATYNIDLTAPFIDYVHGNAIELDYDGNFLISSRHMDEITKINRQTGEIIWRLGGEYCENNQFTFLNDLVGFSHQHDIRRLPNGNILLFDNGNLHDPPFSRAVEYQLDEVNKTAMLVWEKRHVPETFSVAMGSSRRLNNAYTIIGWGWNSGSPSISEVSNDGALKLQISMGTNMVNYRAFKFPWKTNIFSVNPDTLSFINVAAGDSLTIPIEVINNSNQEIEINGLYNRTSMYSVENPLPVIIPALSTTNFQVTFKPPAEGDYFDDLHIQWNQKNERVAQVVSLRGSTDSSFTSAEDDYTVLAYSLSQNYPNPFNPVTKINFTIPEEGEVIFEVYDVLGQKVKTLLNERMTKGSYNLDFNAGNLSGGVYIYLLKANDFSLSKKMILLK
jgi:hypothetical protein